VYMYVVRYNAYHAVRATSQVNEEWKKLRNSLTDYHKISHG